MAIPRKSKDILSAEEKPAATLFVRRGAIFRRAEEAKLRPGEPVFVKEPSGA
jgi:hypothetical protein